MFPIPGIRQHRIGLVAALGLLIFATQGFSQSGRRSKPPVSAPTPQPAEATPEKPGTRELNYRVELVVGQQFTSRRMLSEEAILANFVKRLNEFKNVQATTVGDFNRNQARKQAKQETDSIVLLLQFDVDSFQKGTYFPDSPDLDVRVLAFLPVSGQEKFKGKVYYKAQQGPMVRRDNWPGGTPIRITTEAVGAEVAEQVHDWLLLEELRKSKP